MQSCGAGASLPDSRDLVALTLGHTSTRQEEVATALCHLSVPHSLPPCEHISSRMITIITKGWKVKKRVLV